jgi:beta-phosphoglucomutase-like phosphatase (HAD superfamily)
MRLLNILSPKDILPEVITLIAFLKKNNIWMAIGSSSRNAPLILL